jgi:hypothetical protein
MKDTEFFPSTLPISFIVLSLVLNAISIKTHQRPFKFYLRGDNVKWISHDMLFSFLLFLGSMTIPFWVDSLF